MSQPLPERVSTVSVVLRPRLSAQGRRNRGGYPWRVAQRSASSTGNTTTPEPPVPAGLGARFGALVVDWILCVLVAGLFSRPAREPWGPTLVLIFEYAFFLGVFGQTPGMWLARIRCISITTGGPIGVLRATLRAVLLCLLIPALIMDDERRGLHDRAAGSMVVAGR